MLRILNVRTWKDEAARNWLLLSTFRCVPLAMFQVIFFSFFFFLIQNNKWFLTLFDTKPHFLLLTVYLFYYSCIYKHFHLNGDDRNNFFFNFIFFSISFFLSLGSLHSELFIGTSHKRQRKKHWLLSLADMFMVHKVPISSWEWVTCRYTSRDVWVDTNVP